MGDPTVRQSAALRDYLQIILRRKWVFAATVVLVPTFAVLFSLQQHKLFEGKAEVLLTRQNLATGLTGTQDPTVYTQADRIAQTQADVARVPAVVTAALRQVGVSRSELEGFLGRSSVSAKTNADLLVFRVSDRVPSVAVRLANAYARAYTAYRHRLDTAPITRARTSVKQRLAALEATGDRGSALYTSLLSREEQLAQMQALLTSQAYVVQEALRAQQVQPRPVRNVVLGLVLGIVLGLALAFLWEALDTRVRSAEEIGTRLGGLPLLGRLPEPSRPLRASNLLAMLSDPAGLQAEAFRSLRTSLELATLDHNLSSIMVTSALAEEGKSTTVANLAVAFARTGLRVALVDLDLRRPFLHKFFMLDGPGVTQVALGHVPLEQAIARFRVSDTNWLQPPANGNGHVAQDTRGVLEILPAGASPPDPGEFVRTRALAEILARVEQRVDLVFVDAPPMLGIGDAMTLSAKMDAIVLVTRMNRVRRQTLADLGRQLATCPAAKLGFVVTASGAEAGYDTYGGYGSKPTSAPREPVRAGAKA